MAVYRSAKCSRVSETCLLIYGLACVLANERVERAPSRDKFLGQILDKSDARRLVCVMHFETQTLIARRGFIHRWKRRADLTRWQESGERVNFFLAAAYTCAESGFRTGTNVC